MPTDSVAVKNHFCMHAMDKIRGLCVSADWPPRLKPVKEEEDDQDDLPPTIDINTVITVPKRTATISRINKYKKKGLLAYTRVYASESL
jgi:hypothetical protein